MRQVINKIGILAISHTCFWVLVGGILLFIMTITEVNSIQEKQPLNLFHKKVPCKSAVKVME